MTVRDAMLNPTNVAGWVRWGLPITLAGTMLGLVLFNWLVRRLRLRTVGAKLERRFQKGTWRMGIAPDGMSFSDPDAQSFVKWHAILRIEETPSHAFFYLSERDAHVLPARAFASDVEFRTFVGLARKYKDSPPAAPPKPSGPPDAITRTTDFTS